MIPPAIVSVYAAALRFLLTFVVNGSNSRVSEKRSQSRLVMTTVGISDRPSALLVTIWPADWKLNRAIRASWFHCTCRLVGGESLSMVSPSIIPLATRMHMLCNRKELASVPRLRAPKKRLKLEKIKDPMVKKLIDERAFVQSNREVLGIDAPIATMIVFPVFASTLVVNETIKAVCNRLLAELSNLFA